MIWRTRDNRELRIFSTTIPAEHRLPTLMAEYERYAASGEVNSTVADAAAKIFRELLERDPQGPRRGEGS